MPCVDAYFRAGQWLEAKHGAKPRRTWREPHLTVDADSGMVAAQILIDQNTDDPSQVVPLVPPLAQIEEEIKKSSPMVPTMERPPIRRSRNMVAISK
jgi:hypothetical protein